MTSQPSSPTTNRRQATENRLLDALETALTRDGLRQLNLNAVVAEAGVGKPLVYRYFGGLTGLLTAWVERRGMADSEIADMPPPREDGNAEFLGELADRMVASADGIRSQPVLLEMLAEELTAESELTEPFSRARRHQSKHFMRAMLTDNRYTEPEIRGKIIILYAAVNYLAMRARRSPNFMGIRLDTDEGWEEAMDMVRTLVLGKVPD